MQTRHYLVQNDLIIKRIDMLDWQSFDIFVRKLAWHKKIYGGQHNEICGVCVWECYV